MLPGVLMNQFLPQRLMFRHQRTSFCTLKMEMKKLILMMMNTLLKVEPLVVLIILVICREGFLLPIETYQIFPSPQSNPVVLSPMDQPQGPDAEPCEADADEPVVSFKLKRKRLRNRKLNAKHIHDEPLTHNTLHKGTPSSSSTTRRKRRSPFGSIPGSYMYPNWWDYVAAAAVEEMVEGGHVDLLNREAMQQLIIEEGGKRIVKPQEVRNSTGPTLERWKAAAEAELTNNFIGMGAVHESTREELAAHGRPLPMLCVWSQAEDYNKCRACVCGNFAENDPTQQSWTAQAEPSSLLAGLKLGRTQGWTVSKHDVKGAFLNAKIPEGKIVIVSPPEQWVRWGLVKAGVYWTLDRAVYGLRESPHLWAVERDAQLTVLKWSVKSKIYKLQRCSADS